MHIALITHYYAPEAGAPQRRWGALVPRFVAAGHPVSVLAPAPHHPQGHAVDLAAQDAPGAVTTGLHGETVHRLPFREHGPDLLSRTLDQAVVAGHTVLCGLRRLEARPDLVIATVPGMPSIAAGVAVAHGLRVPLVLEMRDAWPDLIAPSGMLGGSATGRPGWRGAVTALAHRGMTLLQRDAAAVVTTTEGFAQALRARSIRRVEVVRNGAYLDELPALGPREPRDASLRVLYLGTVGRSQGLGTAVRAAAHLQARGVPVHVRIIGSGADHAALQDLARRLGAPVDVLPAVPREAVLDQYRWADTVLVSLRAWAPFRWTVPSKLYEALAVGRHVTAALAGEAAELVRSTGAGDVVPPEDAEALQDLWRDLRRHPRRLEVGGCGRRWASTHADYDMLARQYLDLLEDVAR